MQKRAIRLSPAVRSVGVISAVAVLVGGATFAALQSQATITGNTISSASADMLVDSNADGEFSQTEPGFAFEGIVPGISPSETHEFTLQNEGATDLAVMANVSYNNVAEDDDKDDWKKEDRRSRHDRHNWYHRHDDQTDPTVPSLPEGIDQDDIIFTFSSEGNEAVSLTWEELSSEEGKEILGRLTAGSTATFTVKVELDESVTTDSVDIGNFDIVFTGKAIAAEETPEEEVPAEETPAEETPVEEVPAEQ